MTDDFLKLFWMRRAGCVKRWHTERTTEAQSVSQHCWNVATLLLNILGDDCSRKLLIAALHHDTGEGFIGDVPSPTKRAFGYKNLEEAEVAARQHLGAKYELSPVAAWYLEVADSLEGLFFTLEERLRGNCISDVIYNRYRKWLPQLLNNPLAPHLNEFLRLYHFIVAAYEQTRSNQTGFLQAFERADFWQQVGTVELERIFGVAPSAAPTPDQRSEPGGNSQPTDPTVSSDSAADTGTLQEAIDDWYHA